MTACCQCDPRGSLRLAAAHVAQVRRRAPCQHLCSRHGRVRQNLWREVTHCRPSFGRSPQQCSRKLAVAFWIPLGMNLRCGPSIHISGKMESSYTLLSTISGPVSRAVAEETLRWWSSFLAFFLSTGCGTSKVDATTESVAVLLKGCTPHPVRNQQEGLNVQVNHGGDAADVHLVLNKSLNGNIADRQLRGAWWPWHGGGYPAHPPARKWAVQPGARGGYIVRRRPILLKYAGFCICSCSSSGRNSSCSIQR